MARAVLVVFSVALALSGCKEPLPGESLGLLDLSIYKSAVDNPQDDPWAQVAFVRIGVNDQNGESLADKFVTIDQAAQAALDAVPFGQDLRVTIEGWSQDAATGTIGQLVSRGRTQRFSVSSSSDPQLVGLMISRVNAFGRTSQAVEGGSVATSMSTGRIGHTVTLLSNGQVLIAGGAKIAGPGDYTQPSDLQAVHRSVEIYDPNSGVWTEYAEGIQQARAFHTATVLADGRVALTGGVTDTAGTVINTVEVFDPTVGGSFQVVGAATLNTARAGHTASLIEGGDHLVLAGGFLTQGGTTAALGTVEVFCVPGAACESSGIGTIYTDNMVEPRYFHTASRVAVGPAGDEAVALIGGEGDEGVRDNVETFILNPASVLDTRPVMSAGGRTRHTATYIDSQKFIHVVGGFQDKAHTVGVQRIDSFQVQQQAFQGSQEFYALHPRGGHAAVAMPGNAILLFGGFHNGGPLSSAEVIFEYFDDASQQTFIDRGGVAPMSGNRGGCSGALLQNDTVLVVGGLGDGGNMSTTGEFFNPL